MNERVDIVMATYNGMPYIRERLQSILWQDYPQFRLLIHDDGSTDGTVEEIRKLAERYSKLERLSRSGQFTVKQAEALFEHLKDNELLNDDKERILLIYLEYRRGHLLSKMATSEHLLVTGLLMNLRGHCCGSRSHNESSQVCVFNTISDAFLQCLVAIPHIQKQVQQQLKMLKDISYLCFFSLFCSIHSAMLFHILLFLNVFSKPVNCLSC